MDSVIIITVIFILLSLILKYGFRGPENNINNKHRPNIKNKPVKKDINDKIVIVKYLQYDYLIQAINQFCNLYNQDNFIALPRLIKQNYLFIIVFPYNINFDKFCFFVNYLGNAHELREKTDYQPNVKAWCSTLTVDNWITDEILNKNVMLSIPESDSKKDKMFLATNENIGYKLDMSQFNSNIELEKSSLMYENIPVDVKLLKHKRFIDFN